MSADRRKKLEGAVAIVTGGASGIGRALSEELADRGAEVVLADRQLDLAIEVQDIIRRAGGGAEAAELDVRDADAFQKLARDVRQRAGRLDYLFNNAGIGVGGDVASYTQADWDDVLEVNLRGVTHGIQAVYPGMIEQGSGHIVNTASMAGLVPTPGEASYVAAKFAVVGLSRALRGEARRHGVRVSALCPGPIRTPILTGGRFGRLNMDGVSDEHILRLWERTRPMAPRVFARRAVDAVLRDEAVIVLPSWWKLVWYLDRASPGLSSRLWTRVFDRLRADLEAHGARPRRA